MDILVFNKKIKEQDKQQIFSELANFPETQRQLILVALLCRIADTLDDICRVIPTVEQS
jgi:hypothetical protein